MEQLGIREDRGRSNIRGEDTSVVGARTSSINDGTTSPPFWQNTQRGAGAAAEAAPSNNSSAELAP